MWRTERGADSARVTTSARNMRVSAVVCLAVGLGFLAYALFADDFIVWRVLVGLFALVPAAIGIAAWRMPSDVVLVEILDDGISLPRAGVIRWNEIEEIRLWSIMGQQALGIWTVDSDLIAKRIGKPWAHAFSRIDRLFGWPQTSISGATIPLQPLLEEIAQRRPGKIRTARG